MWRRSGLLGIVVSLVLLVSLAVPVFAQQPIPHSFWGTLTIGGSPAAAGTEVTAVVEGGGGSYTTTVEGQYGNPPFDYLVVAGEIEGGALIKFYVDGAEADQTATFHQGRVTELDLTVEIVPPVVTTSAATDVTTESATLNGNLDSLGEYSPVDVSFEWGEASGGPYPNETTPETMTSTGLFSAGISGLAPDTPYYFRAKATGSVTVYGDELSFTTLPPGAPEVTTNAASGITDNSATLNGNLDSLGDYSSVDVSFEWGDTEGGPYPNETPLEEMTSIGTFSAGISGLAPDTTYYFRAKATGSVTVYGDELSFTTEGPPGTLGLVEGVNIIAYTGVTTDLPGALTNIGPGGLDVVDGLWARGAWTGGAWWSYNARIDYGDFDQLEAGRAYIIVVTENCTWELP